MKEFLMAYGIVGIYLGCLIFLPKANLQSQSGREMNAKWKFEKFMIVLIIWPYFLYLYAINQFKKPRQNMG